MEKNQGFKKVYLLHYVVEPNNQRPITIAFLSDDKMNDYIKHLKFWMYHVTTVDLVDNEQTDSETTDN